MNEALKIILTVGLLCEDNPRRAHWLKAFQVETTGRPRDERKLKRNRMKRRRNPRTHLASSSVHEPS